MSDAKPWAELVKEIIESPPMPTTAEALRAELAVLRVETAMALGDLGERLERLRAAAAEVGCYDCMATGFPRGRHAQNCDLGKALDAVD